MEDIGISPEKTSCRVELKTDTYTPRDFSEITTTLERKKELLAYHLHPFIHSQGKKKEFSP